MSEFLLQNYETSWLEKLAFLSCPIYSKRHFEASCEAKTWQGRTFHLVVGAIESTLVLGALVALIEAYVATVWLAFQEKSSKINAQVNAQAGVPDRSPMPLSAAVDELICEEEEQQQDINPFEGKTTVATVEVVLPEVLKSRRENAASILTTKGFEKESGDRLTPDGYRGEEQGNSALRFATAKATKEDPAAISPAALKDRRELNLEQYLILKIKRFGHVFNLKGHIPLPSGKLANLEAFSEAFTVPMIASSFDAFAEGKDRFSPQDREWIVKNFNKTTSSDYTEPDDIQVFSLAIQDSQFKGPISLGTGHHWHSTGTIFYGNYLIFCNRGGGDREPGIHVYFLPDRSLITEGIIWEMTKRQEVFGRDEFGLQRIVSDLGGELVHYEQMTPQSVGNCTYTSMLCALYAFAVIRQIENFFPGDEEDSHLYTDPDIWHQAFEGFKPDYEEFLAFDKELILEDMMEEIKEWLDGSTPFGQHPLKDVYRNFMDTWKRQSAIPYPVKYEQVFNRF